MSVKVDQFCDKLRERLNSAEAKLKTAKATLETLPRQADKAVHDKLDSLRQDLQARKAKMEKTRANLQAMAREKMAETKEAVNEWKAKHEMQKLHRRADRAEAYAADAVELAVASFEEAEEAILDAIAARMDADTASK